MHDLSNKPMKADGHGAWRAACWMLKPPTELGKVAFVQDQSDRGPPARSNRASWMALSKEAVASLMCLGGQVRRDKGGRGKNGVRWSPSESP